MVDDIRRSRRSFLQLVGKYSLSIALPGFIFPEMTLGSDAMSACLFADDKLARYGFPEGHPFGTDRQQAFLKEADRQGLLDQVRIAGGRQATVDEIARFHTRDYVERVHTAESNGLDFLDAGDTPVFPDVFATSSYIVGSALNGLERIMNGTCRRTLQPIGGLHHAGRGHAAGFCVFNDLGVVIETLRARYGITRIAYIDIDVHFGDGVFYAFESDPNLIIADVHQDPRTLYPGTGFAEETGKAAALGTKLNIPLEPGSGDQEFLKIWPRIESHLEKFSPEFFIFQCGADGLDGDPLASLAYTAETHRHAAKRLCALADRYAKGRLMAFGGGGYNRLNLGQAWSAVLSELLA